MEACGKQLGHDVLRECLALENVGEPFKGLAQAMATFPSYWLTFAASQDPFAIAQQMFKNWTSGPAKEASLSQVTM